MTTSPLIPLPRSKTSLGGVCKSYNTHPCYFFILRGVADRGVVINTLEHFFKRNLTHGEGVS
jgi:hypothetical protein